MKNPENISDNAPLIKVEGVSKKFCLSLKKSLWYGLCDMGRELTGRRHGSVHAEVGGQKSAARQIDSSTRLTANDTNSQLVSRGDAETQRQQPITIDQPPSTINQEPGLRPKEFWAVHDVSFELKRGECLGLIGRNGAGKTTLLKMLNGLIKPDAGRIEMRGRVGALISLGAGFNGVLTGRENIYTNASVLGLSKREIDAKLDEIIDFAEIGDFLDTPVQNYSSGMAVRLGFAVASSLDPDILLVDEVLAVGDLGFRYKCFRRISELMERAAVIFVSHDMASVARLSNRIMLMGQGQIQMYGDDCPAVIQQYNNLFKTSGQIQAGTGEIDVTDIRIMPVSRRAEDGILHYGEDIAVECTMQFKGNVPEAHMNITFMDQANNQVAQCLSARQGFSVQRRNSLQRVRMVYRNFPFNPGSYSLWLVVYEPGGVRSYSVHYGACPFVVSGDHVGYIPIQPVTEWSVDGRGDVGMRADDACRMYATDSESDREPNEIN